MPDTSVFNWAVRDSVQNASIGRIDFCLFARAFNMIDVNSHNPVLAILCSELETVMYKWIRQVEN